ncbi:hypothetical protein RJG79_01740 [Mycoplasmatota bacterium WC44]
MIDLISKINNSEDIPNGRAKLLDNNVMNSLTSKINLSQFNELRNKIFWVSELLYKVSFQDYFSAFEPNEEIKFNTEDMLFTYPLIHVSSELCKLFENDFLFTTLSSILVRQLIEHYCLFKECKSLGIESVDIFHASVCSHNKLCGLEVKDDFPNLKVSNPGLFKVLDYNVRFTGIAKKYKYGFAYNLFSGDAHLISSIEKQIPSITNTSKEFNRTYLMTLFSLLCDMYEFYVSSVQRKTPSIITDKFRLQVKDS